MSEIAGQTDLHGAAATVVHESYSFACMRCGHGWEQSYEIEQHTDADGTVFVLYVADGRIVPSPLSRPTCAKCDGHLVRIMAAGQVSSVQSHLRRAETRQPSEEANDQQHQPHHHWHLSDLLHPFHRSVG
ncbi:hypothetical protein [Streptomyces sp. YIM S03343]